MKLNTSSFVQVMFFANCMLTFANPINQMATASSSDSLKISPHSIIPNESPIILEPNHQRHERSISFRPLFAYREDHPNNAHPLSRRHIEIPNSIDKVSNSHPDVYPYFPYPPN